MAKQKNKEKELLDRALIPEAVYDDGNNLWFMERDYNALFCVTKEDFRVKLIGTVPGERFMQERLYPSMTLCREKLYFVPNRAEEIAEYDLHKERFRKIPVPIPGMDRQLSWKQTKFFGAEAMGNKVYFIPDRYPGILCYDTKTGSMSCFDEWVEKVERLRSFEGGYFVSYVRTEDKLILPCICADAVVIFDMVTGVSCMIKTSCTEKRVKYIGIVHAKEYFYLITADGAMQKRKLEAEDEEVIRFPFFGKAEHEIEFYPAQYAEEVIYLLPLEGNRGVRFHIEKEQGTWEPLLQKQEESEGYVFLPSRFMEGRMYTAAREGCSLIEYNFKENSKREISWFSAEQDRIFLKKRKLDEFRRLEETEYIRESEGYPLSYLLETETADRKMMNRNGSDMRPDVGKRIYDTLSLGERV